MKTNAELWRQIRNGESPSAIPTHPKPMTSAEYAKQQRAQEKAAKDKPL